MRQPEDRAELGYPGYRWPTPKKCANPECKTLVPVRGEFCAACRSTQQLERLRLRRKAV